MDYSCLVCISRIVIIVYTAGSSSFYFLKCVYIFLDVWVPYCGAVFNNGSDESDIIISSFSDLVLELVLETVEIFQIYS